MIKEALGLVEKLNNESCVDDTLDYQEPYEFRSDGNDCAIYFMGIFIWSDNSDEREWVSEHEKEPLRVYIIRASKTILTDINSRLEKISC